MGHFKIGFLSFGLIILFPFLYLVGLQFRRISTWSKREQGPKERVGFFLLIAAIFGFGIGCFAQPVWNKGVECKGVGKPLVSCLFFN